MESTEIIKRLDYGRVQKYIFILSGIGWGMAASIPVWIGLLVPQISSEWNLSYLEATSVAFSYGIGVLLGSYFWGPLTDQLGRMIAYKQTLLLLTLGLFLGAACPSIWFLTASYLLVGFACGGTIVVDGTVFLEYCKASKAHYLIALAIFSPLLSAVIPAISFMYNELSLSYEWRLSQITLGLISCFFAIFRFWIKETPMYLLSKLNTQDDEAINRINERGDSIAEVNEKITVKQKLLILFKEPLRKYTILYINIWCWLYFTFVGVTCFLPELLKRSGFENDNAKIYEVIFLEQIGNIYISWSSCCNYCNVFS